VLEWIVRGLRKGIVTTPYPRRPEPEVAGFRGRVEVVDPTGAAGELEEVCPTRAIRVEGGTVTVDRGRCILCGACVAAAPERFRFSAAYETALVPRGVPLGEQSRPLRRSVHIRHVDAGSDGAEEWEIAALTNPYYDMQRLGLFFTLSPRHADVLLVTGGVTGPMRDPLLRAYEVMPEPKAVVAAGTDACSGGFAAAAGEVAGGVDEVLPVDVYVPGSPPSPIALLHGLLLAAGIVSEEAEAA
jgi:Ni,Fe-hydrogenase III small subunit/NAD-dependent dihydropyrimidine dehydrogenase PreA subunit